MTTSVIVERIDAFEWTAIKFCSQNSNGANLW